MIKECPSRVSVFPRISIFPLVHIGDKEANRTVPPDRGRKKRRVASLATASVAAGASAVPSWPVVATVTNLAVHTAVPGTGASPSVTVHVMVVSNFRNGVDGVRFISIVSPAGVPGIAVISSASSGAGPIVISIAGVPANGAPGHPPV